ncbi:MAG: LysR family transcriptional regulator [Lachnospiraceae bacterium]|nr:LysR family transcriptional regulator [Lachnospiraceae bacterium]
MFTQSVYAFIAVAKYQNYTRAAESLYITQPALSNMINRLERDLDMQLLIRTRHSVELTPAGKYMFEVYETMLAEYEEHYNHAVQLARGFEGEIKIGLPTGYPTRIYQSTLQMFHAQYPHVNVSVYHMKISELQAAVHAHFLDCAVLLDHGICAPVEYATMDLFTSKASLVFSTKYIQKSPDSVSMADFYNADFYVLKDSEMSGGKKALEDLLAPKILNPEKVHYVNEPETMLLLASSGLGFCLLDDLFISTAAVEEIHTYPCNLTHTFVAVYKKDASNIAVKRFTDLLKEALQSVFPKNQ